MRLRPVLFCLLCIVATLSIGSRRSVRGGGFPPFPTDPDGQFIITLLQDGVPVSASRSIAVPGRIWRTEDRDSASAALARLYAEVFLAGPTEAEKSDGKIGLLPEGSVLDRVRVEGEKVGFYVTVPAAFVSKPWDELCADHLSRTFVDLVRPLPHLRHHLLFLRSSEWEKGVYKTLDYFLPELPPVPVKEAMVGPPENGETHPPGGFQSARPPGWGQPQPTGALTGKTVFVSAGHGWYYSSTLARWATQRGNNYNLIEDFSNAEAVNQYLLQYLWNAGANVWPCRERDMNTGMDIIDNVDSEVTYAGTWTVSSGVSGYYGSDYRWALANPSGETATVTYAPVLAQDGSYAVYAWYTPSSDRSTAVKYLVNHSGGTTVVEVNQQQDARTWRYLGTFYFAAYAPVNARSVVISNHTSSGSVVIADAIRFGGGMGDSVDGGSVSGEPRWEESGKYFSGFMGYTYSHGTVSAMPRYAAWENESWEDSIYVSWHTNAGGARGTSSFAYASGGWDQPFNGVAGSLELRNGVHDEIMNDVRASYDPVWPDVGKHAYWLGELNPTHNNEMPSALFEIAFHDDEIDANAIKDPEFRQLVARAVYQGIVKWWNSYRGNPNTMLLPEPPTHLAARNNGSGGVTLSWQAPPFDTGSGLLGDPATSYKVYTSTNGKGFDNGTPVSGTSTTLASGLLEGAVYYFRVTALNAGGESFPTETLAARYNASLPSGLLVVNGFDRLDRFLNVVEEDPHSGAYVLRGFLDRMNRFDYVIEYAEAIDACGKVDFDSCSNEAVIAGEITLDDYAAVMWILGEESTFDRTFDPTEQSLVQAYLDGGGNLFVSGAEIGWDLDYRGNGTFFYNDYLKADYVADDAETYTVQGTGGIFSSVGTFAFDDGTHGNYDVNYPDMLSAVGGSVGALGYVGVSGGVAGVQYSGSFKVVNLGFPFEMIVSPSDREQVMAAVLDFFGFEGTRLNGWAVY